jgi:hypothetical protein
MTTRRWMIAVAVVGLFMGGEIGGVRLKRRHDYFLTRAREHEEAMTKFRSWEQNLTSAMESLPSSPRDPFLLRWERVRSHAAYHEKLKNKYEHAARYPWLPNEPDPPMPSRKR